LRQATESYCISNKEDFTDFVNELKLFIALVLDDNKFHTRGPLCLGDFIRLIVLIDKTW